MIKYPYICSSNKAKQKPNIMTTIKHQLETKECLVIIENKIRYYEMTITLKNGFISIGYPKIWNRLKDAKEFIKNNYNN
jgi:hypothetical protein